MLAADLDLLNPPADYEKRKHKLKRLVQSPNSFFMDVKCQARDCCEICFAGVSDMCWRMLPRFA